MFISCNCIAVTSAWVIAAADTLASLVTDMLALSPLVLVVSQTTELTTDVQEQMSLFSPCKPSLILF